MWQRHAAELKVCLACKLVCCCNRVDDLISSADLPAAKIGDLRITGARDQCSESSAVGRVKMRFPLISWLRSFVGVAYAPAATVFVTIGCTMSVVRTPVPASQSSRWY